MYTTLIIGDYGKKVEFNVKVTATLVEEDEHDGVEYKKEIPVNIKHLIAALEATTII
jgi:hypothetical protein